MSQRARVELSLLLPEAPDARDACVSRLEALLLREKGITRTHLPEEAATRALCIHYDPGLVTLAQVERLAITAGATVSRQFGHILLALRAVDSEDAAPRIERALSSLAGVLAVEVNLAAQFARIEFNRNQTSRESLEAALRELGYASAPAPAAAGAPEEARGGWYARNTELAWSLMGGLLLAVAWAGQRWLELPRGVALPLYAASYALGGWDLVRHWVGAVRKGRLSFDIDLLMLLAAIGAAALGDWAEGAFLLFLFSLAHALEHYALGRARNAIRALSSLTPATARVLRGSTSSEVPVEAVAAGEVVLVRPAERIPVDGLVQSGRSTVNQAPITGESVPVEKVVGSEVFAGTVNGEGALEVKTTRAVGDRTLDRVVKLVEEAQTQKAPTQRFTDRFERIFVPAVLVADVALILVPPLIGAWNWSTSFYRGMALLVAASPCALALGTPAAVLAGIAQAARRGVLIKGGAHLENLGRLRALAFDKTGTLTEGRPEVTDLAAAEGVTEAGLLRVAAAVERLSQHPLATAVVRSAEARNMELPAAGELMSLTARGVRSSVEGRMVEIGNLRLWEEAGVPVPAAIRGQVERLQALSRSVMVVRHGEVWLGSIGMADRLRPGAPEVLKRLRAVGLQRLVMLTGDNRGVAEQVGAEAGVDEVRAELLPEDKVTVMKQLLAAHGQVAMVGDGVNDAPALAHATVGIAMGAAGTAVALETADVALMADDLGTLPFAVGLSRQASAIIRQNLLLSLAVIVLLVLASTTGFFGIGAAVLVHEGSSLVVIANALRLLTYEEGTAGRASPPAARAEAEKRSE
ncbi:heavy metal translocating P-type ATPase [Hyalangium rubrum]|uniref:P-type Zn(2+) transporter n=1 Tax=Hyalangium rubrum TaxID=3103134 RepID=A0ABU5H8Q7_9BACT|nr:heavy metal translocating P-type ATPase [Hyalangium sp. s54d21]MDY7229868.1 heavy metal translocating P-type ATPase [Hyalangium sp. s54d21]